MLTKRCAGTKVHEDGNFRFSNVILIEVVVCESARPLHRRIPTEIITHNV